MLGAKDGDVLWNLAGKPEPVLILERSMLILPSLRFRSRWRRRGDAPRAAERHTHAGPHAHEFDETGAAEGRHSSRRRGHCPAKGCSREVAGKRPRRRRRGRPNEQRRTGGAAGIAYSQSANIMQMPVLPRYERAAATGS